MAVLGAGPLVAGTVHVADDTFIKLDDPSANFGIEEDLWVFNVSLPSDERRVFVRFDLSILPAGLSVSKAIVRLFVNDVLDEGSIEFHLVTTKQGLNFPNLNSSKRLVFHGGPKIRFPVSTPMRAWWAP